MCKVLLVNPPLSLNARYGALASAGACVPPFGLCSLAAVCLEKGWEVQILDAQAERLDIAKTLRKVLAIAPKYIGISITTPSLRNASLLAEAIKARHSATVIVGGPHVTSLPEETLMENPAFDIVVTGEGEVTFPELLEAVEGEKDLTEVAGLAFRGDSGIIRTSMRPLIPNLDLLPKPAWYLLTGFPFLYHLQLQGMLHSRSVSIMTSRGCTGRCTFCDRSVFGNFVRVNSAEYVFELLSGLNKDYNIRFFQFEDDNFTVFPERVEKICDLLIKSNLNIEWSCLSRMDTVDFGILKTMKKAGCRYLMFGIESGNPGILRRLNKGIDLEKAGRILRLAKKAGLKTKGFFILGSPGETRQTVRDTLRFIEENPLDDISITFFTPFPGSPIHRKIHKYGRLVGGYEAMTFYRPVFIPYNMTAEELQSEISRIYKRFYLRPRIVLSYLRRISSPLHLWKLVQAAVALVFSRQITRKDPV